MAITALAFKPILETIFSILSDYIWLHSESSRTTTLKMLAAIIALLQHSLTNKLSSNENVYGCADHINAVADRSTTVQNLLNRYQTNVQFKYNDFDHTIRACRLEEIVKNMKDVILSLWQK